jgi:hypothetical protein
LTQVLRSPRNQAEVVGFIRRTWVIVVAFLALTGSAQAAGNARLLAKFQPVTSFDSAESFRPTSVETFIGDSNLERFNPVSGTFVLINPSPTAATLPGSGAGWRLNQRDCVPFATVGGLACYVASWSAHDPPEVVYGRVARLGTRIVLQYWYFYYANVYIYSHTGPQSDFIWQSHEGDWEVVNVVLRAADDAPLYVGYSQHCLGQRRNWSKVQRWRGTHPIVYVGSGSHANYLSSGQHAIATSCLPAGAVALLQANGLALPVDYADGAARSGPAALGADETTVVPVDGGPNWVAFPGFWGELQYFKAPAPVGIVPIGTSPVGPAYHAVWIDPLGTLATWPSG